MEGPVASRTGRTLHGPGIQAFFTPLPPGGTHQINFRTLSQPLQLRRTIHISDVIIFERRLQPPLLVLFVKSIALVIEDVGDV